jgi:guanylate kinase
MTNKIEFTAYYSEPARARSICQELDARHITPDWQEDMPAKMQRDSYQINDAIVSIDEIQDLGTFLYIKVDIAKHESREKAWQYAGYLKSNFNISESDIIPWSYSDLHAMHRQAQLWRGLLAKAANKGQLFLIGGPSGSGKTTVTEALRNDPVLGLTFIRRHCTRSPRSNQENEYIYVTSEQFRSMAQSGQFLDFRHFQFGMSYGLSWDEALKPILAGHNALALINWGNARHVRRLLPEVHLILSRASIETLRRRLLTRGIHDQAQLDERLENAQRFSTDYSDYNLILENEDGHLTRAVEQLRRYILEHGNNAEAVRDERR